MRTRELTVLALLIALTTAATMVIRIPVPATQGYLNLGDSMVYVSALLFGPLAGLVAGGIGSALADWLGGYAQFALYTLVIKGLEGLLVGLIAWGVLKRRPSPTTTSVGTAVLAILVGGALMVGGYFVVQTFIMGTAGLAEVPGNIIQVIGGLIIALPVTLALRNAAPGVLRAQR
ncbi:MAG: ECF transporter S component [bacterium]